MLQNIQNKLLAILSRSRNNFTYARENIKLTSTAYSKDTPNGVGLFINIYQVSFERRHVWTRVSFQWCKRKASSPVDDVVFATALSPWHLCPVRSDLKVLGAHTRVPRLKEVQSSLRGRLRLIYSRNLLPRGPYTPAIYFTTIISGSGWQSAARSTIHNSLWLSSCVPRVHTPFQSIA